MFSDIYSKSLDKEKLDAALRLIKTGISPTNVAKQLQIGRSTLYHEVKYAQ
ncbi:helix-turn-helix domain-containing protein [Candidatus Tisiphia endosymbiont of Hybos culiciformis]|uniref:helix-turn-helix domain-containing protein n=1 Tax=Candidatus Tisiphia endosymbiont of Hybos culiciformis TaxID=3139331 RepID=UPI003CCB143E